MPRGIPGSGLSATATKPTAAPQAIGGGQMYQLGPFLFMPYNNGQGFEVFKQTSTGLQNIGNENSAWRGVVGLLASQLGWLSGYKFNAANGSMQATGRNIGGTVKTASHAATGGGTTSSQKPTGNGRKTGTRSRVSAGKAPAATTAGSTGIS